MAIDTSVRNNEGYFKDPFTKKDFSKETPRSIEAHVDGGKFIWPRVRCSDGSDLKIVFRLFTDGEKSIYRQHRYGKPPAPAPAGDYAIGTWFLGGVPYIVVCGSGGHVRQVPRALVDEGTFSSMCRRRDD